MSSITDVPSYLQYRICGSPCRWMYSHMMMSVMLYIQNIIYIYIYFIFLVLGTCDERMILMILCMDSKIWYMVRRKCKN